MQARKAVLPLVGALATPTRGLALLGMSEHWQMCARRLADIYPRRRWLRRSERSASLTYALLTILPGVQGHNSNSVTYGEVVSRRC